MLARARMHLADGRLAAAADALQEAIDEADGRGARRADAAEVLTPAELRVARLAGAGMKNREIADKLCVTVKAVEYHLANTYRKLNVRGRDDLPRVVDWAAVSSA